MQDDTKGPCNRYSLPYIIMFGATLGSSPVRVGLVRVVKDVKTPLVVVGSSLTIAKVFRDILYLRIYIPPSFPVSWSWRLCNAYIPQTVLSY